MQTAQCVRKAKTAIKSSHCPETSFPCARGSVCVCLWGSNRFYIQRLLKEKGKEIAVVDLLVWGFFTFSPPGKLCGCLQSLRNCSEFTLGKGEGNIRKLKTSLCCCLEFLFFPHGRGQGGLSRSTQPPDDPIYLNPGIIFKVDEKTGKERLQNRK